jgi:hypothetical protein
MARRILSIVLILTFSTLASRQHVRGASPLWLNVGTGIEYREFFLPETNHVYVARMDRANPNVTLESSLAQGRLAGGLETVREQAKRYDQAIGYWGGNWGMRNQVVVAINGSFYNPETSVSYSGIVNSGWYTKRFEELQNVSGVAWTLGRQAFIGGCVMHKAEKQLISFLDTGKTLPFDGINAPRKDDELIIYTPQYGVSTMTDEKGVEALVELSRPMMIMPFPEMITGTVKELLDGRGASLIPFDGVILSARGVAAKILLENTFVGGTIGISQEIRHFEPDCKTAKSVSWTKTYASLASGFTILADGVIQANNDLGAILRNPRTAIAFNDRYVYFIVVDGRDRLKNLGMSMVELANFAKNTLGAVWGAALDGGGSSTMVVNGEVKNNPNAELVEQSAVFDSSSIAGISFDVESGKDVRFRSTKSKMAAHTIVPDTSKKIERAVANGMMMVVAQPIQLSTHFQEGDPVMIVAEGEVNLRLGPGTNYGIITVLTPGSHGVILKHALNGVLAKDMFWWKILSGDVAGWLSEEYLTFSPTP